MREALFYMQRFNDALLRLASVVALNCHHTAFSPESVAADKLRRESARESDIE
jgi:hypothetical protein